MPKPFRVLSLDGGGMRGLYTATVLKRLANHFATKRGYEELDVGAGFDLIVGTSTGGLLAVALAHGQPLESIIDFYVNHGPKIFTNPVPYAPRRFQTIRDLWWIFRNRKTPANDNHRLKGFLENLFTDETLGELFARRTISLCIPAVDVEHGIAKVFKTPHLSRLTYDAGFKLVDVCLATSAAPVYFPLVQVSHRDSAQASVAFADGGLWVNNPILVGILESLEIALPEKRPVQIISIGTCPAPPGRIVRPGQETIGVLDWLRGGRLSSLFLDSQASGATSMAGLLKNRLRGLGFNITVYRLPASAPSTEQSCHLQLDCVTESASRVLQQMGRKDADAVISACDGGHPTVSEESNVLTEIFEEMPPLKSKEIEHHA